MTGASLPEADYERLLEFRIALRTFLRRSEDIATAAGTTAAVHQLLLAVRGRDRPTIGAVADALGVRHHSAVELAQRAEREGLIDRARDADDHRSVHLTLTPAGVERLEAITREHLPELARLAEHLASVTG